MGLDPHGIRSKTWPTAISGHPSSLAHHKSTALRSHILCLWRSNAPTWCTVYFYYPTSVLKIKKSCTAPVCSFDACTCLRKINKYSYSYSYSYTVRAISEANINFLACFFFKHKLHSILPKIMQKNSEIG
jgi:hypothetical protein